MAGSQQLGLVLTPYGRVPGSLPWEINKTGQGFRQLCPQDWQYFQRGEYGFYTDTALGGVRARLLGEMPTDAEQASYTGWYTPVKSGWVTTNQGYLPPPWTPPRGGLRWWGPTVAAPLNGFGSTTASDDVVKALNDHHQRLFILSALSTTAVVASSLITAFRTMRLIRNERKRGGETK